MEYRIKIENNAVDNRYYCIVARPPYVADVGPNQLMTPVLSNLDIVPIGNTETFRFKHEYFAFVGKLTRSGTRPAIERNNHLPVNFGTVHDNGPTIDVYFENNGMRIKQSEETGTFSRRGSFIIRCGKQPPASVRTEFVVGLAINLPKEGRSEVVPIAAMRYIADKPYEITHSGTMCICSDTEGLTAGDVVQSEVQRFVTIDFSSGARSVELVEDERENFTMVSVRPPRALRKSSLCDLFRGQPQAQGGPMPFVYENHRPEPAKFVEKWMEQARALGLATERQVNAYDFLEKYNKTQLAGYYQAEKLKEIARNADAWGKTISEDRSLNDEFIDDLLVLALFDCILFLDNSLSMTWGERKKERREISAAIVKVETIFHNTKDVRVEFLNGLFRGVASEPEDMEKLLNGIRDFGKTPLGTELEAKVLNNYVYPKLKRGDAFRPVLISVITDGAPQGELKDTFKKKIKECKALLNHRDKTRVGDKHVLFQISRVGDDHDAKAFIKELKNDPDLKGILHCTSYLDLDIDPEDDQNDPVNVYAPAIRRLAGAAFVGLERDSESQRFKFMDS